MTYRLFEGKDHAFIYHQYRIPPPEEVKNRILQYLDKKVCQLQKPHAVTLSTIVPLSMSSEGTATRAGGGPGMWDGPTLAGVGATLPAGGGFRRERESAGAGQSCARTPQHLIWVRVLHMSGRTSRVPLLQTARVQEFTFVCLKLCSRRKKQGMMTLAAVKI